MKSKQIAKHTPGPWEFKADPHGFRTVRVNGRRNGMPCNIVVDLYDENNDPKLSELEANARLIAAAPELLSALQAIVRGLPELDSDEPLQGSEAVDVLCGLWPSIKSAIAKAEGK